MSMTIYHGSKYIIAKPEFGKGNLSNDYGRGFYCTESPELAKEWACAEGEDGFANCHDFDTDGLRILNLGDGKHHILNWLALLTKYRGYWQRNSIAEEAKDYLQTHFLPDISGYDVIVGYRADDSYFSFAQDFIMGAISLEQLSVAMQLGKLGEQIVLKSRRAFEHICYKGNEEARAAEYYLKKTVRDKKARAAYCAERKRRDRLNDLYMIDIMRREMTDDDIRI